MTKWQGGGRFVLTGDQKQRIYILDSETGNEVRVFQIPGITGSAIDVAVFSDDETKLFAAIDSRFLVYDLKEGVILGQSKIDLNSWMIAMQFIEDGSLVASDHYGSVWRWENPEQAEDFQFRQSIVSLGGVKTPLLNKRYATANKGWSFVLLDVLTGKIAQEFLGHTGDVTHSTCFLDCSVTASVAWGESNLRFWETRSGRSLVNYALVDDDAQSQYASSLAATENGDEIVVGTGKGKVVLFRK